MIWYENWIFSPTRLICDILTRFYEWVDYALSSIILWYATCEEITVKIVVSIIGLNKCISRNQSCSLKFAGIQMVGEF